MAKKEQTVEPSGLHTPAAQQPSDTQPQATPAAAAAETETGRQQDVTDTAGDAGGQQSETAAAETVPEDEYTPFADRAAELFASYPRTGTLWFTSDVTAFFSKNDALNHAKTLDDMSITKISR
jgi:hypothetical protein